MQQLAGNSPYLHLLSTLKSLRIRTNLLHSNQHLLQDPLRNGLLLYQILQNISHPLIDKKPFDPVRTLAECRENLLISLESLIKNVKNITNYSILFNDLVESILKGDTSFFEAIITFINSNRNPRHSNTSSLDFETFLLSLSKIPLKNNLNIKEKEGNIINWLNELGLLQNLHISWDQLVFEIIKGELLFKIYEKYSQINIKPVHKVPNNESNCIANLRKFLHLFRNNKNFSQKFLWMEMEVLKGNKEVILGLLDDIRFGLECDGIFKRSQLKHEPIEEGKHKLIKNEQNMQNMSENELILMRPLSERFTEKIRGKMHSLIGENVKKIEKIAKIDKISNKNISFEESKIFQWLESMGFKLLAEELKENKEYWFEFQDGLILGKILNILEKNANITLNEKPTTKAHCIKNIKEALKPILHKKNLDLEMFLSFNEEDIFEAQKSKLMKILLNIKSLYEEKSPKLTKGKIKSNKSCADLHYFDLLTKSYVLNHNEREKMLILPKYIDDNH